MDLLQQFYIKDKTARKVKFKPKKAQLDFLQKRTGRDYILKARQMGFTTLGILRQVKRVLLNDNMSCALVAHESDKLNDLFRIAKYAWDNLPEEFKGAYNVKYDNVRELYFNESSINAYSRFFIDMNLRSGTVQDLHISELALNKDIDRLFASSLEAVPKEGSITIETTGNGLNRASEIWFDAVAGKNEFTPHFYNWTWDEEYFEVPPESNDWKGEYKELAKKYDLILDIQKRFHLTDSQYYWYYLKARRQGVRVKEEYPTTPEEAFLSSSDSVFDLFAVSQIEVKEPVKVISGANIYVEPIVGHKYIIGVDTAEGGGGDRTAIGVLDVTEGRFVEVASFSDPTIRPDQSADTAIRLARLYNNALIVPEKNSSGLTTVLAIRKAGYRRLFRTKGDWKVGDGDDYGWRTTFGNRDVMIDDFMKVFEEGEIIINSAVTKKQMETFVRKENGRREHDTGFHDDSLFALFLALQGVKYLREVEEERAEVYHMFSEYHVTESVAKDVRDVGIGIDYSPDGLVYEVFGIDWIKGQVVGIAEGKGGMEDIKKLKDELGKKGHRIIMYGLSESAIGLKDGLRKLGLRGFTVSSDVGVGIGRVQALLNDKKMVVSKEQEELIKDMKDYLFDTNQLKKGVGKPVAGFRYAEAMRLAIMGMWSVASKIARSEKKGETEVSGFLQSGEESANI